MRWTIIVMLTLVLAVPAMALQKLATSDDLAKLQADLQNLEADLATTSMENLPQKERERIQEIDEEVIYLKVKMRKHESAGGEGTGVTLEEVRGLRLDVADLRNDLRPYLTQAAVSAGATVTIPAEKEFSVRLEDTLGSATSEPGDRFTASAAEPIMQGKRVVIDAGSLFHGRVEAVDRAGGRTDRTAKLVLVVNELEHGGKKHDVSATVIKASERLETGLGSEAKKIGIGAGIGTALGAILGGKKGAVIGAAVGGSGSILATQGNEVELPRGTILYLRLDDDLTLPTR